MTIPNRPRLADLVTMPVGAVTALPAETLALLQEEADEALRAAKTVKDWLDGALALKYGSLADQARAVAGKDTGTVRFANGPVTIVADLPKRVEWDQSRLARPGGPHPPRRRQPGPISSRTPTRGWDRKSGPWPGFFRFGF
uniref:Uncharacterized protein n=1 Tax=Magnetospirillum gryphiswaldense TaxID=55518 RepID=A4U3X0_9PROT|nr:conserved hypothetical protein [Magnetospirillum gryphiswaldense MSR-1]